MYEERKRLAELEESKQLRLFIEEEIKEAEEHLLKATNFAERNFWLKRLIKIRKQRSQS